MHTSTSSLLLRIVATVLAIAYSALPSVAALAQNAPLVPQAAPAISGTRIVLAGGTPLTVAVDGKISSANANVGDTFGVRAAQDVVIGGWVAIAKGAIGQGEILSVDRAGSHGHPGSLGVQMDWIYAVDGEKVRLTSQRSTEQGQGEGGKSSTITILSWAFLGLPGLFAHNFVKGHDVEIDDTHPLTAYVDASVYVVASTRSDAAGGFAAPAAAAPAAATPAAATPAPTPIAPGTSASSTPPVRNRETPFVRSGILKIVSF